MTRLWIVRHGNTFAADDPPRRIGARTDLPLVESGREQAHNLGRWFAAHDVRFDRVLASSLRRTRETAALICGSASIETRGWLAEIDHGPDEDQPEAEVVARIGAAALTGWDRDGVAPVGWTVDRDARIAGWQALMTTLRADHGDVLVVTSNGAARFALFASDDLRAAAAALPTLKLRTGAWGRIDLDPRGARLAMWDRRP